MFNIYCNCISAIKCPVLRVPSHGKLSSKERRYGSVVYVSCRQGYILDGTHVIQCQATARWNDSLPYCISKGKLSFEIKSRSTASAILYTWAPCLKSRFIHASKDRQTTNRHSAPPIRISNGIALKLSMGEIKVLP